ncbi:hypothetical protein CLOM_g9213, partial [Closterium sp. NIES-68]
LFSSASSAASAFSSSSASFSPFAASPAAASSLPDVTVDASTVVAHPSITSSHGLTPNQLEFRALAQDFAANELLPRAAEWDAQKHFPVDVLRKAAGLGFAALFVKEDVGGSGLGRADGAVIFEALAHADVSTTAYLTIHNMNASIIDRFGSEEQRHKWLPALATMDLLSSYCLTEPGSGSDAAALKTTARQAPGSTVYILNGSKAFISGATAADVYLVMARTDGEGPKGISCFLVEKDMPGVSFGQLEKKLGWNSQPTAAVILEDVRVPAANLIGGRGNGFRIAMTGLDGGRVNIGACSVGGAQFCLEYAQQYAADRKQFGKPITLFQNTQFQLADMATAVEASRLMVRNAATGIDIKAPWATTAAAMAKRFATDNCYQVANQALQLLGGYGFLQDYPVERYVRDLRVHTILEGTNEIMRLIIARRLLQP